MTKCIVTYDVDTENDIQLSFSLENGIVETVAETNEDGEEYSLLKVTISYEGKSYGSLSDSSIFTRANYLIALGIMSFLIDEPLDVFGSSIQKTVVDNSWNPIVKSTFIKDGKDYSHVLKKLLGKILEAKKPERELIFSLLDRWRKARYLERETEESLLYNDEATLSYFHVLELLSHLSSKQILADSKVLSDEFCKKYNENILSLSGSALGSETTAKAKLISSLLDKDISVYAKISYFLKKYNLFDEKTSYWTKVLIEARNSVAHGRNVFNEKSLFIAEPFFPLSANKLYPLEFLRFFSAKVIAFHIGVTIYDKEWKFVHENLNYGEPATKLLLNLADFEAPIELSNFGSSVVFGGLNDLVLSNKINIRTCVDFYHFYLKSNINKKNFMATNVYALIILLEATEDENLTCTIVKALTLMKEYQQTCHIRFRDLIYELDFHGFDTKKLEDLVSSGQLR